MKQNNNCFILGGARSGKSHYAETLARKAEHESGFEVVYIATARAGDEEMARRIRHHQKNRPGNWKTIEEPLTLSDTLKRQASPQRVLLVDCLTLWLMNLLMLEDENRLHREIEDLLASVNHLPGQIILVSNEVGLGIIPMGELTRRYVDEAGWLHQQLAKKMDQVILMVAGLPHHLKGERNGKTNS